MDKEKFSIKRRIKAFGFAFQGIAYFVKTVHNAWIQVTAAILTVALGCYLHLSRSEWLWIIAAIAIVFMTELINTAIEKTVDLASAEYHELAKRAKDLAAGAVLLAALFALIIGVIIFYPYFQTYLTP